MKLKTIWLTILYCPICGKKMTPYTPDLTPLTYGPLDIEGASGDLENPMEILLTLTPAQAANIIRPSNRLR